MRVKNFSDLKRTLNCSDHFGTTRILVAPKDVEDCRFEDIPLVAVIEDTNGFWTRTIDKSTWNFWVYGLKVNWEDLGDDQRMVVRMTPIWGGMIRDQAELRYKDERYYTLEALI